MIAYLTSNYLKASLMNVDVAGVETPVELPRAGFWRRWLATIIDGLIVFVPFQMLAAVLFAMTAGMIQMESGLFSTCEAGKTIPQTLDPPPPHDSNFVRVCRVSFFGATTGATMAVGRFTREGNTTRTVSQGYLLDRDGTPIHGVSIDWIVQLAFVIYLIAMIWKTGRTVGARVVGVRVIDTANSDTPGVPLLKATGRYLAMIIGAVPAFALLIFQLVTQHGIADAMFTGEFFRWFAYAGLFGGLWTIVLIVQIARKTDPIYDRLAGTAVVRV